MITSDDFVKAMQLNTGQLCTSCVSLVPGEHTVQLHEKEWGTLKSLSSSAQSCSLCAVILSGRQDWLEEGRENQEDIDETRIDACPLRLTLTPSQLHESGVSSNKLVIYLVMKIFVLPHFFFIMGCESEALCATLPVWKSFPTTIDEKVERMKTWFRICQSSHSICKPKTGDPPTRLIEVGSQTGREPRLVYSNDLTDQHPKYAALSYCWGDTLPIRTLKAAEAELRRQIPYRTLPRTFQDAIAIARILQLHYIWIDALCIIQDDDADWEQEANRMQQIYSGSTLTIAASGARDTSAGFFAHEYPRFRSASIPVGRAHFSFDNYTTGKRMIVQVQEQGGTSYGMTPILQTRGWALQETVLSNRIVQCVQSELYWRCNQGCQTESGVLMPTTANWSWNVPVLDLKDVSASHKVWWKLVEDYSGRAFTFQKDRIPAMAGLVSHFQEATNDLPCLGMWNRTLPQDLAWMRIERLEPPQPSSDTKWNFPSWTWLSCPVSVIFEPEAPCTLPDLREIPMTVKNHVKIRDWHVLWQGLPFTSKLKSTRLFVEGPVQELLIEIPADAKTFKPPYCIINNKLPKESEHPIPWCSTVQFDREEWNPTKTWTCLLLQSTVYPEEQRKRREDTFLLIEPLPSDNELGTFRRVGIGISRNDENVFNSTVQRIFHMV